jgi:hypothetical protein
MLVTAASNASASAVAAALAPRFWLGGFTSGSVGPSAGVVTLSGSPPASPFTAWPAAGPSGVWGQGLMATAGTNGSVWGEAPRDVALPYVCKRGADSYL